MKVSYMKKIKELFPLLVCVCLLHSRKFELLLVCVSVFFVPESLNT